MSSWHPSSALLVTGFVAFVVVLSWNWWRPVRPLGHGIVLTLVGAVALLNASLYRARADDAFITYRYARNLAEGNGPVFNVHERVEGYSNFLWMCVLAAWHAVLGVNVEDVARVLGVVAALAAVFATYWLALVLTDGARTVSAAAALLLASAGPFAAYSLSGLETPLFALLVVVLTVLVIQERVVAAGVVAALATMTRPDGLVFVAVAIVWLLERAVAREIRARQVLWFLGSFGALFIPWTVWRVAYYGYLVPNALAAKTGGLSVVDQLRAGLDYMNSVFLEGWPLLVVAAAVVGVALLFGARFRFSTGERLIVLEIVAFVAFLIVAGGDWMPASRLFVPAIPLVVALLGSVWYRATSTLAADRSARTFGVLACLASLLLLAASFSFFNELPRIRLWRSQVEALATQGDWFDATLPAHTSIATYANGALSDHAGVDKNVIDMLGLTDEHIARDGRRLHSRSVPIGHRAYDYRYVVSRRPEIVIFSPTGFAGGPSCAVRAPFAGDYVGTSFRFAPGNSTGRYVNLFVRSDRAAALVKRLSRPRGVTRVC